MKAVRGSWPKLLGVVAAAAIIAVVVITSRSDSRDSGGVLQLQARLGDLDAKLHRFGSELSRLTKRVDGLQESNSNLQLRAAQRECGARKDVWQGCKKWLLV